MKKKKENIWELLKRLDEEAGYFNAHLSRANHYFDTTAGKTKELWSKHEQDLQKIVRKLKKAMKPFLKKKSDK